MKSLILDVEDDDVVVAVAMFPSSPIIWAEGIPEEVADEPALVVSSSSFSSSSFSSS